MTQGQMCCSFDALWTLPPWMELIWSLLGLLWDWIGLPRSPTLEGLHLKFFLSISIPLHPSLPRLSLCYTPLFFHLQISCCHQDQKYLPLVGFCSLKFTSSLRKLTLRKREHFRIDSESYFFTGWLHLKSGTWETKWALHPDPNSNPVLLTVRSWVSPFTF